MSDFYSGCKRKYQIPIGVSNLLSLNERMPTWNHTRPREQDSHVVHYSQCAICFLLDEPYIPTLLGSLPFKHVKRRIMEFWSRESFPLTFFEASQLVEMLSHLCGPSKVGKSMYSLLLAVTGGAWCSLTEGKIWRKAFTNMGLLFVCIFRLVSQWKKYATVYPDSWLVAWCSYSKADFSTLHEGIEWNPWLDLGDHVARPSWPSIIWPSMHWLHEIRLAVYIYILYIYGYIHIIVDICIHIHVYIYLYVYLHQNTPCFSAQTIQGSLLSGSGETHQKQRPLFPSRWGLVPNCGAFQSHLRLLFSRAA